MEESSLKTVFSFAAFDYGRVNGVGSKLPSPARTRVSPGPWEAWDWELPASG